MHFVNVIIISVQPFGPVWQEPEPIQATGMTLIRCVLGKFLGVGCHYFPLPLDILTFTARCSHVFVNICVKKNQQIPQLFIQFINHVW
jgi:hypothetical protein